MAKFKPNTNNAAAYGSSDWRPILSDQGRKGNWGLSMLGKQSVSDGVQGVILPSHNYELDTEDKAFLSSVGPCWTNDPEEGNPNHFEASAWGIPLLIYPYMGETKEHWLSPKNRETLIGGSPDDNLPEELLWDAFDDLNRWIRRNKDFKQADKDFFLKSDSKEEDPLVPGRTTRYFSMGITTDRESNGKWSRELLAYTASAHAYILEQLRWYHIGQDKPPLDPDWPRYLLGDPTNPARALVWHANQRKLNAKDTYNTNILAFTRQLEFLDDPQVTHAIPQEDLDARFCISDPSNWNIPTYEDQIRHMINHFDPHVTADMIRAACGHRTQMDIPDRKAAPPKVFGAATRNTGQEPPSRRRDDSATYEGGAPSGGANMAPIAGQPPMPMEGTPAPTQPTPPAPTPPAPTMPAAPDPVYWSGVSGSDNAVQRTAAQLQQVYDAGNYGEFKVQVGVAWKDLADCGCVTPAAAAPPVPAAAPAVPSGAPAIPAGPPATPEVPAAAPTPTPPTAGAPAAKTKDEMRTTLFPDPAQYEALTPENKAEAEAILTEVYTLSGNGQNPDVDLPSELVDRLLKVVGG